MYKYNTTHIQVTQLYCLCNSNCVVGCLACKQFEMSLVAIMKYSLKIILINYFSFLPTFPAWLCNSMIRLQLVLLLYWITLN